MSDVVDVRYKKLGGWNYVVVLPVEYVTGIYGYEFRITYKHPESDEEKLLAQLKAGGRLFVYEGYAWDGASGPAIDTPNWMDPSLVHDIFYQALRQRLIPQAAASRKVREIIRKRADNLMYEMLRQRGMHWLRAWLSHFFVRRYAGFAADPNFDLDHWRGR